MQENHEKDVQSDKMKKIVISKTAPKLNGPKAELLMLQRGDRIQKEVKDGAVRINK